MTTLHERGVRAPMPTLPRPLYHEYWSREVLLRSAAVLASLTPLTGTAHMQAFLNALAGERIVFTDIRYIPALRRTGTHGFVLLPGGCAWALKKHGGCAFCSFQREIDQFLGNLPPSGAELLAMFEAGWKTMREDAEVINVFTGGSFLNPGEIPQPVQMRIVKAVARAETPQILRVESRLEYLTPELISPVAAPLLARGKHLDVAIGFETEDDFLRNRLLRKGMAKARFERAIATLKQAGARVSAYLMLKPHRCMGEGYAIAQAVDSIQYVFSAGVDEVLLQARYLSHSAADLAWWQEHGFRSPWLWSIAHVLHETARLGPVNLGRWDDELPPPVEVPHNCGTCDQAFLNQIASWRHTLDPSELAPGRLPDCPCRQTWLAEVSASLSVPEEVSRGSSPNLQIVETV